MYFYSEDEYYVCPECEVCKRILQIPRYKVQLNEDGLYCAKTNLKCICGNSITVIKPKRNTPTTSNSSLKCPKCSSRNIDAISGFKKGASVIAFGVFAANTVLSRYQCKSCKHKFT